MKKLGICEFFVDYYHKFAPMGAVPKEPGTVPFCDEKMIFRLLQEREITVSGNDNTNAVIYSKNDLTLNGEGSLVINFQYGNGIISKEDLVFTSGTYTITASGHGL